MAIARISTPDGDRLKDTRTGKLAGSPPRKPRVPKPNPILVPKNSNEKGTISLGDSPVEKSFEKFTGINAYNEEKELARAKDKREKCESFFDFAAYDPGFGEYIILAFPKGLKSDTATRVGRIRWSLRDDGRIQHIEVDPEHRRKGLATALYNHAALISTELGIIPPCHHEARTREGDAWARSVGGEIPPIACEECGEDGHYTGECLS